MKIDKELIKEQLLKLYFSSPPKIQFFLAKYVMKSVVNKNQRQNEELIRH